MEDDSTFGAAELLGSLSDLTDPTSETAGLMDLGSAFIRFSEVLTRFLPM